jgi:hypothetical protein
MDYSTTTKAYAMMEKSSTMLLRYVSVIGIVTVVYDYLLTIQDEVFLIFFRLSDVSVYFLWQIRFVWPGGLSFTKSLYFINRYMTLSALLFCTYGE